jgi:hypothetical protein
MGARKIGVCAYCGKEGEVTRDHIPPNTFFSRPLPADMLTVPSCAGCNTSFKNDDDYTLAVTALDFRVAGHQDVLGKMSTLARALQRREAKGFRQSLVKDSTSTGLVTPSGSAIGKLSIDVARVEATGAHIVRGLHYIETGKPVPPSAQVHVRLLADTEPSNELLLKTVRLHDLSPTKREKAVGNAFSYSVGLSFGKSVWGMMLYGHHFFWVAVIGEPPDDE